MGILDDEGGVGVAGTGRTFAGDRNLKVGPRGGVEYTGDAPGEGLGNLHGRHP